MNGKVFKTHEAALYLNISVPTLMNLVKEGKIPFFKTSDSGHYRFKIEDLEKFIERKHV